MDINKLSGATGKNMLMDRSMRGSSENVDFENVLKQMLGNVNESINNGETAAESLALGDSVELHQVMLAAEQANLSLQLTVQIRNKILEAYQEVMRMQV